MLKKLSIKAQILLLLLTVVTLSVFVFAKISIDYTEKTEFEEIDHLLTAVVHGASNIIGDAYHENIQDSLSISEEQYKDVIEKLSILAQKSHVKVIYAYIDYLGKIRFTASSSLNYGTDSCYTYPFFEPYADDPLIAEQIYFKPLRNDSVLYTSYEDVYGKVRTAFVPFTTPQGKRYVIGADLSFEYIDGLTSMIKKTYIFVGAGILILALLLSILLIIEISKPLRFLVKVKKHLADNNFELPEIDQKKLEYFADSYKGEIGKLAEAFVLMQSSLKQYIINLSETTKAKEKIESQLRIASSIQMGMIPKEFEGFPDREEFNICGFMKPAREVGGDLYNFFMIDEEHLGFTIGDVSDKGIPAALFMAMTNTLIKAIALTGVSPAEVLFKVNNELCRENEQGMFVTLFLAKLNIKTGVVEYANAGHNPFILHNNKEVAYQKLVSGMVLAAFENFTYTNEYLTLNSGDTILMYTDGVTEAMNFDHKLYGEGRLLDVAKSSKDIPVKSLIEDVIKSVENYVQAYEQSDDITLLTLRFNK